jgi:phosphoribosylformylglycinamidine synthase subunit PurS
VDSHPRNRPNGGLKKRWICRPAFSATFDYPRHFERTDRKVGGRAEALAPRFAKLVGVKARVYVTFKPSVLDPQGQTIRAALNGLGHRGIEDVRQGKFFEITMQPGEDLDSIARDVLSNPVIEDYRIERLD